MRKLFLFVAATLIAMSFTFVYANDIVIRVKETGQVFESPLGVELVIEEGSIE